jgi:hypothetical protein
MAAAMETIAQMRQHAEQLRDHDERTRDALLARNTELDGLRQEFDEFKEQVRGTAIRYAERHDWCEAVDRALVEMGLPGRNTDWTVTLTVTGTITRTVFAADEQDAIDTAKNQVNLQPDRSYEMYGEQVEITEITAEAEEDE